MNSAIDVRGKEFKVGQQVARAAKFFVTDGLHVYIAKVTKVDGKKIYLDSSSKPLTFPERVAIID